MACPFLSEKRKNNMTTVLQPCQVFFQNTQTPTCPQAMEVSMNALTLKVTVLILVMHESRWNMLPKHQHETGLCLSGISPHHQHGDHHSVRTEPCHRDPRGAGESCFHRSVGETKLERSKILVPGRVQRWRHKISGSPGASGRVIAGIVLGASEIYPQTTCFM